MSCPSCGCALTVDGAACPKCGAVAPAGPSGGAGDSVPAKVQAPATATAPDQNVGRVLGGKFEILELIGQGGMGKVYRARHLTLDRQVCVKTLKPSLLDDATLVGRFEREAKAASRLNHPNSIQVLDFGQDGQGGLYLVMELVRGRDLRKVLRDEFPLAESRVCHIVGQVLSALAEAHAQGVIHRDLKPENIMLEPRRDEPDFVKVLDFGIAKIQDPGVPGLTRPDVVCGTPLYMSPEQATGSAFDARADLYAVGVILYQLTTGTLPFEGANSMEILTKHVTQLPVPPRERRPEVPVSEAMEGLILRALAKDPAHRPSSAEAFRAELLRIEEIDRQRERAASGAPRAGEVPEGAAARSQAGAQSLGGTGSAIRRGIRRPLTGLVAGFAAAVAITGSAVGFLTWRHRLAATSPSRPSKVALTVPKAGKAPVTLKRILPPAPPKVLPAVKLEPKPAAVEPRLEVATGKERAWRLLARADKLYAQRRYAQALDYYRQAARADSKLGAAYRGVFRVGLSTRDWDAARAGGEMYLRVAPKAPDAPMIRQELAELER